MHGKMLLLATGLCTGLVILNPLEAGSGSAAAQPPGKVTPRASLTTYPPLKTGQLTYTVSQQDSHARIEHLVLPDNLVLKFAPNVTRVDWQVVRMTIGRHVLIDASAPSAAAARRPKKSDPPQASHCTRGIVGDNGRAGSAGKASTPIRLLLDRPPVNNGSLWIKTDGQPGQPGQHGQDGGQGGGRNTNIFNPPVCGQGDTGGAGGRGGAGGAGGAVSRVHVAMTAAPSTVIVPQQTGPGCGPSRGSDRWNGQAPGIFEIFGRPGCRGAAGARGGQGRQG